LKNYKVYQIQDINDKTVYVGLTGQPLSRRFAQHVTKRKWNRAHYKIVLIQEHLTLDQAVILEEMLILQYNTRVDGLNVSPKSINGYSNLHSPEMKARWSKDRKGKKVSEEHAAKNRIARLGHKNSKEHQDKIIRPKPVMCLETGKVYKSAREAARDLNLHYSKISLVCNGLRISTGGYHFKFV
jgi:predicted GIY-YIG superfamily endonuclease